MSPKRSGCSPDVAEHAARWDREWIKERGEVYGLLYGKQTWWEIPGLRLSKNVQAEVLKMMRKGTTTTGLSAVDTTGDFSPGIVMGNYIANMAMKPSDVGLEEAFKISLKFRPSNRGYSDRPEDGRKVFVRRIQV